MADEAKPKKTKRVAEPDSEDAVLTATAKVIGKAAGKIASIAGAHAEAPPKPASSGTPKLQKKNKAHLPRREKKAQKKALARQAL